MIKVITHGKKMIRTCWNCGCKFSFEKEDIRTEQMHIQEWRYFVQCPDCKEEVTV